MPGSNGVIQADESLRLYRFRLQTSASSFSSEYFNISWKNDVTPYTRIYSWDNVSGLPEEIADPEFSIQSLFWNEDFEYSIGDLTTVSGGNWTNFSGTGFFIPVISGSLSYPNYASSGIGNKIALVAATTSAEDAKREYAAQFGDGTTVYASFLVNVQGAQTSGASYFAALYSNASGYRSRVFVQSTGTGVQFGFDGSGTSPTYDPAEYPFNSTVLIVMSYEFLAGADTARMWINPTIGTSEPPANIKLVVASEPSNLDAFALRQASSSGSAQTPDAEIDGIRTGTSGRSISHCWCTNYLRGPISTFWIFIRRRWWSISFSKL